ncbi:MAG: PilZ domain-containing protein [Methyloligellaceae bacterium]
MGAALRTDIEDGAFIDRRVVPRYPFLSKCLMHVSAEKYHVEIRDVSIYGIGICAKGSGIEDKLQQKQHVSIEWRYGEEVNATVVWSFKGHYGLLLTPALEDNHPLLVKARTDHD